MYLGRVVEDGPSEGIFMLPEHPYSQALVSAVPVLDPSQRAARNIISISGEPPNPLGKEDGCRFRTRCWKASDLCARLEPGLEIFADGRRAACHHAGAAALAPGKLEDR